MLIQTLPTTKCVFTTSRIFRIFRVPTAALPRTELSAPVSEGPAKTESTVMAASKEKEDDWLSAMSELVLKKDELDSKDFVSWAAYHADRQPSVTNRLNASLYGNSAYSK